MHFDQLELRNPEPGCCFFERIQSPGSDYRFYPILFISELPIHFRTPNERKSNNSLNTARRQPSCSPSGAESLTRLVAVKIKAFSTGDDRCGFIPFPGTALLQFVRHSGEQPVQKGDQGGSGICGEPALSSVKNGPHR
jgi:hypothetical protein